MLNTNSSESNLKFMEIKKWYYFFQNYEKLMNPKFQGIREVPFKKYIKLLILDIRSEGIKHM